MSSRRLVASIAAAALGLGGCGGGADSTASDKVARTIDLEMRDTAFSPSTVTVKRDERIRFVFTNNGKVQHDAFIGDEMEQERHEAEMRDEPSREESASGMHHGGSRDHGVSVAPGESDKIDITFTDQGEQIIGCHEPGHYAAGMKVVVKVE
ncbi:MAG TPA: cupredoxin domain-containing protein [Acidimicrobiales bacterium]|nr:cupredoxin domain-containing protein [Acidimicrobiales bacterium]